MIVNQDLAIHEDLLNFLKVDFIKFQKGDLLLLEFVLNNGAVQESFKRVEKLELAFNRIAIIEGLSEHCSQTSFQLFDALTEAIEVVIKLATGNVHDVVLDFLEVVNCLLELLEDDTNGSGKLRALGASDVDLIESVELHYCLSEVHDVLAPLHESVKPDEESVSHDLPCVV